MAKNWKDAIAAQSRDIEATLPATADRAQFWNRLEHIAQANTSPEQQALKWQEYARHCDELARIPGNPFAEQFRLIWRRREETSRPLSSGRQDRPTAFLLPMRTSVPVGDDWRRSQDYDAPPHENLAGIARHDEVATPERVSHCVFSGSGKSDFRKSAQRLADQGDCSRVQAFAF